MPRSLLRVRWIATGIVAAWVVLTGRLVQLHVMNGDRFHDLAARQRVTSETVPGRPGDIVDRNGLLLATSVSHESLFVVPQRVRDPWSVAQQLGEALQLDADALFERIAGHPERQFLWVKRRLADDEVAAVRKLELPRDVWGLRSEFKRIYPQGQLAAHVIGLRDIDNVGRDGIEHTFDHLLRGDDGHRELLRDARGRVIGVNEQTLKPARAGETIAVTLDVVVQWHTEAALDALVSRWKPVSACAIVMNPQTAEVLAMASRPAYDPNSPEKAVAAAWKNRTISDIYEPGSTFKPFVVAWGLKQQSIEIDEFFNCEFGEYRMGKRLLHDHHKYGKLSLTDVLVKSSNIGMAKIGERLTNANLYEATTAFGFGRRTGIELPGELTGVVRPLRKWNSYSTGSVPMGQEISTTPLQMITAYAALCRHSALVAPRIRMAMPATVSRFNRGEGVRGTHAFERSTVRRVAGRAGETISDEATSPSGEAFGVTNEDQRPVPVEPPEPSDETPPAGETTREGSTSKSETREPDPRSDAAPGATAPALVPDNAARFLYARALAEVVRRGTGKRAALKVYDVFGKTGTAQKVDPVTGAYSKNLHISSFVGGAPADNPRVLVIVVVDEPHGATTQETFGGVVAAPAAGAILRDTLAYLRVPTKDGTLRAPVPWGTRSVARDIDMRDVATTEKPNHDPDADRELDDRPSPLRPQ